jgi:hypothetical protein
MRIQDDNFFERLRWARDHGALNDRLGRSIRRALHADPNDSLTRQLAMGEIRELERLKESGLLPPFKASQLNSGEFVVGMDVHGSEIRVPLRWLCSGLLLIANTGGGKTTLASFWLLQLALLRCAAWIFEPYKIQLRCLLPFFQRAGATLTVLPWQNWRWNLLQCGKRNPNQHLSVVIQLLISVLDLPGRASAILRQGLHELYNTFGVWSGQADGWPTLFHLYEWVRSKTGLNIPARDAILDRLGAFLVSLTPQCGAWTRGWDAEDLAKFSIVFEMRGASESVRRLLPQSILFNTFQARVDTGLFNGSLKLFIMFEDSQKLFDDSHAVSGGEVSALDELAAVVRAAEIAFCPLAQSTVGFSRRLRPNLALKIFGRLGSHEDLATLSADCGLDAEQQAYAQHRLVPGMFVGRVGEGSWTEPFLFSAPQIKLAAGLSDVEVQSSLSPLRELPAKFDDRFAHWQLHPIAEVAKPAESATPLLSETELRFLRVLVSSPGHAVSFYCRTTRLNGKRLVEIRQRLIAQGYIREHAVVLNARGRGRSSIVIEPLAPAIEAVRANPENPL